MTSPIILQPHQIIKLEKRFTQQEIANIFGVNVKTIQRWKYPTNLPKQKRGRKEIFNLEKLDILCSYTITVKFITQKSLARKFSCSQPTICRALQKVEITYKKISYQSSEQLRKKNKEKINFFISETIPVLPQSNFFFLDECSFHLNSAPRRGYYWKNSRLINQRPGDKGKNQSLILLTQITKGEKLIHKRMVEGGVNSEVFHNFLTEFNPPNNGKKNYLIMDNLSVHKATKSCIKLGLPTIQELLISKNIEPIYLPSYTPELNPVEKMFNITRKYVEEKQPRNKDELSLVIERKIDFFKGEDLVKYFESSIRECLMKNSKISNEPVPEKFEKWKKWRVDKLFYVEYEKVKNYNIVTKICLLTDIF